MGHQQKITTKRFVISGRYLPAQLVLPEQVTQITARDLVFTTAEAAALVGARTGADWHARTQGWPLDVTAQQRHPFLLAQLGKELRELGLREEA